MPVPCGFGRRGDVVADWCNLNLIVLVTDPPEYSASATGRPLPEPAHPQVDAEVPKFSFQLDARDPPAKVVGAMVDFSERRPEIWPNLTARLYRVHALGVGTADVTEGTALPGVDVWERVTYEWTEFVVRGVLTDGRIFKRGGTFEFRVEPHGNGSRIFNDYNRRSKSLLGRCFGAIFQLTGGAPIKRTFPQVYGKPD
jgi:hypothetical protein